jgi:hypothetical protein
MFIGHDAVGLASKRLAPRMSLGWLIAAPLLLDLIWPIFLLLGIEHVEIRRTMRMCALDFTDYPWSHSLAMAIAWGVAYGGIYAIFTRYIRGGIVLFIGVVSHWFCDWLMHRPDLPLYPGGPKFGLGLWNSPIATIGIESALFAVSILMYREFTHARDRIGSIVMWAFILFLGVAFAANASAVPPPNVRTLAYMSLSLWLLPLWAAWFDRHRIPEA